MGKPWGGTVFEGEYDRLQDKVEGLEARCEELNEACGVKQVLIDNTASDLRDMRDLYERESASLRAQNEGVGEQLVKAIDDIAALRQEVAELQALEMNHDGACVRLKAEVERLRAALRGMVDYFETAEWRMVDAHEWRPLRDAALAALAAQPAEEPGVPTVDECERIAYKAGFREGVERAARKVEGTYGLGLFKTAGIQNSVAADIRALAQPAATGSCPHEHRDWDTTDGVRCVKCGATHLDRPDSAQPAATGEGA